MSDWFICVGKESSILFKFSTVTIATWHLNLRGWIFVFPFFRIYLVESIFCFSLIDIYRWILNLSIILRHFISFVLQVPESVICFKLRILLGYLVRINVYLIMHSLPLLFKKRLFIYKHSRLLFGILSHVDHGVWPRLMMILANLIWTLQEFLILLFFR